MISHLLHSGPRGRWFKSSHSDQYSQREIVKSVEMLKKLECFGFFRAFFRGISGILTTFPRGNSEWTLVPLKEHFPDKE